MVTDERETAPVFCVRKTPGEVRRKVRSVIVSVIASFSCVSSFVCAVSAGLIVKRGREASAEMVETCLTALAVSVDSPTMLSVCVSVRMTDCDSGEWVPA